MTEEASGPAQSAAEPAPDEVEAPAPPPLPPRERRPASPAAVQQAIDDVTSIIETLRNTLANMEEVLETVELAERQKAADEQEIETLLRKLNQLGRPREGGPYPPRR